MEMNHSLVVLQPFPYFYLGALIPVS